MSLITREYGNNAKMSKLSILEMDNNLLYLDSWDKTHTGGNVTYVPLTKDGKTQTEILNEAIADASEGDTLILASGTYTVVASDWDGDADIEAIVINKGINLVGQGMQATVITCGSTQSDTLEITASNVTVSNMTINNTGHDTTAIWIYPEDSVDSLSSIVIENIRINSYVADGANLGILATNASVDIHDCEITVATVNTSAAGISLYIDPNATDDMNCVLTNNTIIVSGTASAVVSPRVFGNEGIRIFCSLSTTRSLNVNMYNVDSRATTVASAADYGIRVTSATIAGHATEAFKATVNAYNCLFSGTTKDVRVYGLSSISTNVLNLYGCTLENGTPQGVGGATGLPDGAVNNLGIIAAKGIQVADNAASASAFNLGTLRYRQSGTASYCEMSMQTGASSYSWVVVKSNAW